MRFNPSYPRPERLVPLTFQLAFPRAFFTAWAPCLDESLTGKDFLKPTDVSRALQGLLSFSRADVGFVSLRAQLVRDTLESIDLIHEMIAQYPEVCCPSST